MKGEDYGKLYYWTTNWSFWKAEELNYLYLIANNFTDFINNLFEVAIDDDGNLDEDQIRELIRVFRPDREGNLTLIDFAKSVDAVYKYVNSQNSNNLNRFHFVTNLIFFLTSTENCDYFELRC